jgi:hypothetical protein
MKWTSRPRRASRGPRRGRLGRRVQCAPGGRLCGPQGPGGRCRPRVPRRRFPADPSARRARQRRVGLPMDVDVCAASAGTERSHEYERGLCDRPGAAGHAVLTVTRAGPGCAPARPTPPRPCGRCRRACAAGCPRGHAGPAKGHPATPVLEQGCREGESADVRYHPEEKDALIGFRGLLLPPCPRSRTHC